jgi:hypothetical protein
MVATSLDEHGMAQQECAMLGLLSTAQQGSDNGTKGLENRKELMEVRSSVYLILYVSVGD